MTLIFQTELAKDIACRAVVLPIEDPWDALPQALVSVKAALEDQFQKVKGNDVQEILLPTPDGVYRYLLIFAEGEFLSIERDAMRLGGTLAAALIDKKIAACTLDDFPSPLVIDLAYGFLLRTYQFTKYKTPKDDTPSSPPKLVITRPDAKEITEAFNAKQGMATATFFARDLVSEPPNELYPESFADRLLELHTLGVAVDVYTTNDLEDMGLAALLAVGKGSHHPPALAVMRWTPSDAPGTRPIALVGKGITFDTGGLSLKSKANMPEMKWDMAGAAAVAGAMKALAVRGHQLPVVGVVALAENMPSGTALRPSDVIRTLSGKTVEVLNTDAEGRLVLADALTFVQRQFDPAVVIDIATLTGAIISALGHEHAGLYANDHGLAEDLTAAGIACDEPIWRMPLPPGTSSVKKSEIADLANVAGRPNGATAAAQFLHQFIEGERCWAHLDIAGMAWAKEASPLFPKGATGFGVRLIDAYLEILASRHRTKA